MGVCDQTLLGLLCLPNTVSCDKLSLLSCENNTVVETKKSCSPVVNELDMCDVSEVYDFFACGDVTGSMCGSGISEGIVFEIATAECRNLSVQPVQCVPTEAGPLENCSVQGKVCREIRETKRALNRDEIITSITATCEPKDSCLGVTEGHPCEIGDKPHCEFNKLVFTEGTCNQTEMTLICRAKEQKCGFDATCVEDEDGASCVPK